jgi:hypothetical protein
MVMRRTLGALLLRTALAMPALAGCADSGNPATGDGNEGNDAADARTQDSTSPTASTTPSASLPSGAAVDFIEVALLSRTGGGGTVDYRATILDDRAAVKRFGARFRSPALGNQLQVAIRKADVPEGQVLAAAVVAIGCDVPPGVVVQQLDDGLAIVPKEVTNPLRECLAPVTTTALVAVDESAV